jgi:LysR family nitrogen assimilation transcriptional regulator
VLPVADIVADPLKRRLRYTRIVDPAIHSRLTIATNNQHPVSRLTTRAVSHSLTAS